MKTFLLFFFSSCSFLSAYGQNFDDYPYAPVGKLWINSLATLPHSVTFMDLSPSVPVNVSQIRVILLRNPSSVGYGPAYACGFYCNGTCESFLFSLFLVLVNSGSGIVGGTYAFPQVVWSANRSNPVHENATLELTSLGDLLLKDADGSPMWSSGTSGQGVTGLQIEMNGNLVLLNGDQSNKTVWQSFDHPTNALLLGQVLPAGQKLTAGLSASDFSEGPFYLSVNKADGMSLYASVSYGSPQNYWNPTPSNINISLANPSAVFVNNSLDVFLSSREQADISLSFNFNASNYLMPYIGIDPGGFLQVHGWNAQLNQWNVIYDFLDGTDRCAIPSTCGSYGLCTAGTQCACLQADMGNSSVSTDTFNPINPRKLSEGCLPHTQLLCDPKGNSSRNQHFLQVNNVDYFSFVNGTDGSIDQCKLICLQDCFCKAVFFQSGNASDLSGTCYTVTDVYTLRTSSEDVQHYFSVALIKIQNETLNIAPAQINSPGAPTQINSPGTSKTPKMPAIVGISTTVGVVSVIIIAVVVFLYKRRKNEMGEDFFAFDKVPGLPARFKYEELRVATENFRNKLGAGGFGTVFLGALANGEQVAVKRLESSGQGNKEFRAEVCTIGSIHHFNLVRLCGFCAEREHRLLVYEFMPNGSLDRWIFSKSREDHHTPLDWSTRFSIAIGTAQGLAYLHEGCRERILHFDVKPQNILLDEHFIAKVSDFGLSKFMGRDESQVVTTMRGTPGYLAPEWLHSNVTEKADVYSFGIVLLEVVSGQKCFEADPDQQSIYLPARAQSLAEEGKLLKLVDNRVGTDFDEQQAVRMINIALWCIQGNPAKRPAMSLVVQMLEGVSELAPPPLTSIGTHGLNPRPVAYYQQESIPSAVHVSAPR